MLKVSVGVFNIVTYHVHNRSTYSNVYAMNVKGDYQKLANSFVAPPEAEYYVRF